ncbi:MAG: YfhO family protein [Chloroflexi bacterium]|nr:YfhO family protein [Chloroflexota bacterium]MCL5111050.1 YfhO family protein [Chloroflexota bacterium]
MLTISRPGRALAELATRIAGWRWLPFAIIGALTILFFARFLFLGQVFIPGDIANDWYPWRYFSGDRQPANALLGDVISIYYPQDKFIASRLRQGVLPLWDPFLLGGHPLLANGLSAVLYPTRLVLLALLPAEYAHDVNLMLHLFLAGCFTYLFLRQAGLGKLGALVGAIAWSFNGYVMVWFEFGHTVTTAALLPLALFVFDRARLRHSLAWALGLCVVVALSLNGGNIQRSLYLLIALSGYGGFRAIGDAWTNGSLTRLVLPICYCAVGLVGGFALAACTMLPTLELIGISQRTAVPIADMFRHNWPRVALLAAFVVPGLAGGPTYPFELYGIGSTNANEFQGYAGLLTLVLAAAGLVSRRALAVFFSLVAVLALLLVFGSPLYTILYYSIPMFGALNPQRTLLLYAFGVAMLAAVGADYLASAAGLRLALRLRGVTVGLLGVSVVGVAAVNALSLFGREWLLALWYQHTYDRVFGVPGSLATEEQYQKELGTVDWLYAQIAANLSPLSPTIYVTLAIAAGCVLVLWARQHRPSLFPALCTTVIALDLVYFGWQYNATVPAGSLYPSTPAIDFLLADKASYRVGLDTDGDLLFPNMLQAYGISEVGGYQSVYDERYARLLNLAETGQPGGAFGNWVWLTRFDSPILDLLNVKYVLRPPGTPAPAPGFHKVYDGDLAIYENEQALPRAFVAADCVLASDETAALDTLRAPGFNPRLTAVVERANNPGIVCGQSTGGGATAILEYTPNQVSVGVSSRAGGWLVLSDTYDSGWQATVDSSAATVRQVDYVLRGVQLPPGDHVVTFTYRPASFALGSTISAATGLLLAGAWAFLAWRRRRRQPGSSQPRHLQGPDPS